MKINKDWFLSILNEYSSDINIGRSNQPVIVHGIPAQLFIELLSDSGYKLDDEDTMYFYSKGYADEEELNWLVDDHPNNKKVKSSAKSENKLLDKSNTNHNNEVVYLDRGFSNCTFNNCTIVVGSQLPSNNQVDNKLFHQEGPELNQGNKNSINNQSNKSIELIKKTLGDNKIKELEESSKLDKLVDKNSKKNDKLDELIDKLTNQVDQSSNKSDNDESTDDSKEDKDDYKPFLRGPNGDPMAWQMINLKAFPGVKLIKNYKDYCVLDFNDYLNEKDPDGLDRSMCIGFATRPLESLGIKYIYKDGLLTISQPWRWPRPKDWTSYERSPEDLFNDDHPEDCTSEYQFIEIYAEELMKILLVDSIDEIVEFLDNHKLRDYDYDGTKGIFKFYYNDNEDNSEFMNLIKLHQSSGSSEVDDMSIEGILAKKLDKEKSRRLSEELQIPDEISEVPSYKRPNKPKYDVIDHDEEVYLDNQYQIIDSITSNTENYKYKELEYIISFDELVKVLGVDNQYNDPRSFNSQYMDPLLIKYKYDPVSQLYRINDMSDEELDKVNNILVNSKGEVISEDDLYCEKMTPNMWKMVKFLRDYIPNTNRTKINYVNQATLLEYLQHKGYKLNLISGEGISAIKINLTDLKRLLGIPDEIKDIVVLEMIYKNQIEYSYVHSTNELTIYEGDPEVSSSDNRFWYSRMKVEFDYTVEDIKDRPYKANYSKYKEFLNNVYAYRDESMSTEDRYAITPSRLGNILDVSSDNNDELINKLKDELTKRYFKYILTPEGLFIFKTDIVFR